MSVGVGEKRCNYIIRFLIWGEIDIIGRKKGKETDNDVQGFTPERWYEQTICIK